MYMRAVTAGFLAPNPAYSPLHFSTEQKAVVSSTQMQTFIGNASPGEGTGPCNLTKCNEGVILS